VAPRSRDETSVGQPVGSRPVSLRNRESSGARKTSCARKKKMKTREREREREREKDGSEGKRRGAISQLSREFTANRVFPR